MPMAAATGVAEVLTALFVVLLAAKLGDELFKRIDQPAIVGEILAGVLVGPSVLGLVEPGEVLEVFAELGVVFLLFWVGLETKLEDLTAVGRTALLVGVLGVALLFVERLRTVGIGLLAGTATTFGGLLLLGAALTGD